MTKSYFISKILFKTNWNNPKIHKFQKEWEYIISDYCYQNGHNKVTWTPSLYRICPSLCTFSNKKEESSSTQNWIPEKIPHSHKNSRNNTKFPKMSSSCLRNSKPDSNQTNNTAEKITKHINLKFIYEKRTPKFKTLKKKYWNLLKFPTLTKR